VVKVARVQPCRGDKLLVAASVVVIGGVERLTQVADEVQQELERQDPLGRTPGRGAELVRELFDLVDHAGPWRPSGGRDPAGSGG
jgi:hypothetical protein